MPINNITQTISILPPAGRRGVDVQTQFVIKQEDFQDHLQGITVDELNTLKDQLNSRIGEINSTTTTMNGYADTASTGASTATTKAGEASTSASEALTYKNQAETFKNNASASATKASQWSDNNYNVEVETGRYSAKHWSIVAQNTLGTKVDKVTSTDNAIVRFDGTTGAVQNSGVIIDDNGNVGIGTSSPSSSLTIKDGLTLINQFGNATPRPAITSGVQKYGVHAGTSNFDDGFIRLSAGGGTGASTKSYIDISGYSSVFDMYVNIVFGTGGVERARIGASGNVMIGTTTDNGVDKLQVNGSVKATEFNTEKLTIRHIANQWTTLKDMTGLASGVYIIHQQTYNAANVGGFIMFSINESTVHYPLQILNTKGSNANCGLRLNGRIVECIFPYFLDVSYSIIKI